ncbi:TonB-dependent receptor family protein [Haloferula sp.]|uniref:TonB-dependent receptor family protein n=1 Tax=Haloferula sp. TaxID=2497595 RepID=UPI00329DFBF5
MKRLTKRWGLAACAGMLALAGNAGAQDALESLDSLDTLTVIGSLEDVFALPGSGYLVTTDEIRQSNQNNINRVLAKVPGVYVREEDGYGNFPNISIRGGDGTRSEKVTMMEDGILTSPAPYSAPAAYYSPKVARMSSVEILKGSSQVRYGPQTTGGVINYISTPVPVDHNFYTRNTYGTDNTILSHSYYGDTIETENAGRFGYLLELFYNGSDGYREIDPGAGYAGSDDTGFQVFEPMFKFFWEPDTAIRQRFEFKYGYTDFDADETYVGLTEADVQNTPDRRYAATRFDNMATEQHRSYFKYLVEPCDNLSFETALYYNRFERNWRKLDDIEFPGGAPQDVRNALLDPNGLAALQGTGPGNLIVRSNAREYEAYGIQFAGQWQFQTGTVNHDVGFGARLHTDYVERDQYDDVYNQDGTGAIVGQQYQLNNVRRQETDAFALWIDDEMTFGSLTVTPGIRYENASFDQRDGTEDKTRVNTPQELLANRAAVTYTDSEADLDEFIPGISFNYDTDGMVNVFGGVHKGIAMPGPRSAIGGTDVEESIGYELGARYQSSCVSAEFVGFFTDFENILNTNAGTGNGSAATNGGEAEVWGFEALVNYDPLAGRGFDMAVPLYVSATWTSAEFKNTINGGGGDNIYSGAVDGSSIPYIPEWKIAAGAGFRKGPWGAFLDMSFVSHTYGTGDNAAAPSVGAFGARAGKIDSLLIFDLSSSYDLNENITLLAGVANLFDERGIVSRIPRGPRANIGRTAYVGFEGKF